MRSCATRSTNLYGPAHTGLLPNLSPSAWATLGATIMPARSASCASSGANGAERLSRTVDGSTTSTLATGVGAGHRLVALDAVLDRGRIHRLAVLELDAAAQLDRQRLAVRRPLVAGGELRHDVELVVDVEQLVAHRREHDASDEGPRQRRIEDVRILGEADAQGLGLCDGGG